MSLATRIKTARTDRKLSREDLSRSIGCSEKSIRRYEAGESEPSLRHLKDIAAALGVTTEHLINGADPEPERATS